MNTTFDVAIVGAGVVGAAIARALSGFAINTVLIDAAPDVGTGTSKANTAILHTGFDATPGSLEARLVRRGFALLGDYANDTGIAVERTGACLVAWTDEQRAALPAIVDKATQNGVTDLVPLDAAELYRREPHLGPGALAGVLIPGESIICPYSPVIAYATEALLNGVTLKLGHPVQAVLRDNDAHVLDCGDERRLRSRWVINAAGLCSDTIDRLFGHTRFTVTPRRGELIVFDKLARSLLTHILLPVPTKTTKGVLVSPTVFGNVLLGPTADDIPDKTATVTTASGLRSLWEKGERILPALAGEEVTASYAGLRAATEHSDYQIHVDPQQRYVCVGGIRSTGLSASLAIAEYVVEQLIAAGLRLPSGATARKVRMPPLGEAQLRPSASNERILERPDYGRIVCHCERVSRGEIVDALRSPLPPANLDGLRRRTRCLQGRCQGFFCLAHVAALTSEISGQAVSALLETPSAEP